MNWDVFKSNWKQFKDRLKARWRTWDMRPIVPIAAKRAPADWPISKQRIQRGAGELQKPPPRMRCSR